MKGVLQVKYKKIILILSILLIFVLYIGGPYLQDRQEKIIDGFKRDVIRFHIRAHSDRKEDQKTKLLVRDEILRVMEEKLKDAQSLAESKKIIEKNLSLIKSVSQTKLRELGQDLDVRVSLHRENFPIRKYGSLVLPQGEYESLVVELGKAQGENWWCVMFPPLCFIDITQSTRNMSSQEDNNFFIDETQPFKLKSIIGDWFKNIFNKGSKDNQSLET